MEIRKFQIIYRWKMALLYTSPTKKNSSLLGWRFAAMWHLFDLSAALIVSIILIFCTPLQINEGLAERGRDLFLNIAAFGYPSSRSPKSIVITIDDQYLFAHNVYWPIKYADHAQIIEEIAHRGPRAIFIDFTFIDSRPDKSMATLINVLKDVSKHCLIYISVGPQNAYGPLSRPEILRLADTNNNIKLVDTVLNRSGRQRNSYEIEGSGEILPAAVQIYDDYYEVPRQVKPRVRNDVMDIIWGVPRSDFNCRGRAVELDCDKLNEGPVARMVYLIEDNIRPRLPGDTNINLIKIPYVPTITVDDLFNGRIADKIDQQIAGATVFYGGDLVLSGDQQDSPVQGLVPGVQVHAMAFDNLVTFGGKYIGISPPFGLGEKSHTAILICITFMAMLLARLLATLCFPRLRLQPHLRTQLFGYIGTSAFVATAMIICCFEFFVLRVGPGAWIVLLLVTFTGDALANTLPTRSALIRCLRSRKWEDWATRRKPRKPRWRR